MDIHELARDIRRDILDISFRCGASAHLGGGLSMVEIMAVLFGGELHFDPKDPRLPERDRFILSKGHGVLGYFAALKNVGVISPEVFASFQTNGSPLIAHPVMNLDLGLETSNGSLGQGLGFGAGLSLAAKKLGLRHRTFVYMGDGECNEGSVWEAAMLCPQLGLDNLVAIVDNNGLQSDGPTSGIVNQKNMAERWRVFGWHVQEIDGHSTSQIQDALTEIRSVTGIPSIIVANTVKGKGVSFMENNNEWHHNRLTEVNFKLAMEELGFGHGL